MPNSNRPQGQDNKYFLTRTKKKICHKISSSSSILNLGHFELYRTSRLSWRSRIVEYIRKTQNTLHDVIVFPASQNRKTIKENRSSQQVFNFPLLKWAQFSHFLPRNETNRNPPRAKPKSQSTLSAPIRYRFGSRA